MVSLLDNDHLQKLVDYSFGDHSGVLGGVPQAFMKKANMSNKEFLQAVEEHDKEPMTLFIDNIRLYRRPIEYSDWMHLKPVSAQDRVWLNQFEDEDLLELCSKIDQQFIIFTAFEDTPLDDYIWDKIPENVLAIHAANGVVFGGKVHPFPHGIERKMHLGYDHHEILQEYIKTNPLISNDLLFVCFRTDTGARGKLGQLFEDKDWAQVHSGLNYKPYLSIMQSSKFVLCPSGNGIESARNWETLYMRCVPVMIKHPYMQEMYKDFPVLWIDKFEDVTEELLSSNNHLHDRAVKMDMKKLDLLEVFKARI